MDTLYMCVSFNKEMLHTYTVCPQKNYFLAHYYQTAAKRYNFWHVM